MFIILRPSTAIDIAKYIVRNNLLAANFIVTDFHMRKLLPHWDQTSKPRILLIP